jgi:hypothetical protein
VPGCDSLLDLDGAARGKPRHRRRPRRWFGGCPDDDNVQASGFYQRRGMDMVAPHRDFADEVRTVKPWLPRENGGEITFRQAIDLEYPSR